MSTGRKHDLGKEFELSEFIENDELVGYFVTGPAAAQCKSPYEGRCGGLCSIRPYKTFNKDWPVWECSGEWPNITLSPSIQCECGGQHSFVQNGRWV